MGYYKKLIQDYPELIKLIRMTEKYEIKMNEGDKVSMVPDSDDEFMTQLLGRDMKIYRLHDIKFISCTGPDAVLYIDRCDKGMIKQHANLYQYESIADDFSLIVGTTYDCTGKTTIAFDANIKTSEGTKNKRIKEISLESSRFVHVDEIERAEHFEVEDTITINMSLDVAAMLGAIEGDPKLPIRIPVINKDGSKGAYSDIIDFTKMMEQKCDITVPQEYTTDKGTTVKAHMRDISTLVATISVADILKCCEW